MIIWLNGAFGSGKSSVAEAVSAKIPNSYIYDPENVGYFLWEMFPDNMKRKGNFQHIPLWREMNYKILKHIAAGYDGAVIAPQTIYIKDYYDEIIGRLQDDGIDVRHFILSAQRHTLVNRLRGRGEEPGGWAEQHIDKCIKAFETDITDIIVQTDCKSISETADEITASAGF